MLCKNKNDKNLTWIHLFILTRSHVMNSIFKPIFKLFECWGHLRSVPAAKFVTKILVKSKSVFVQWQFDQRKYFLVILYYFIELRAENSKNCQNNSLFLISATKRPRQKFPLTKLNFANSNSAILYFLRLFLESLFGFNPIVCELWEGDRKQQIISCISTCGAKGIRNIHKFGARDGPLVTVFQHLKLRKFWN